MARVNTASLVREIGPLFESGTLRDLEDGPLLERFIAGRDEVAFEELVARHGPVILGICRRSLDDPRDVEDAFQATFLLLVRKAASLRDREAVSSWLYGVALRVTRRARADVQRRRGREHPIAEEPSDRRPGLREWGSDEVLPIVDQEIRRLPDVQQVAVALCVKEGYTHEAAAARLGWPLGTVKSRIASARLTLQRRLTRRGLAPSQWTAILTPALRRTGPAEMVPPRLARRALETALGLANASGGVSPSIARLAKGVMRVTLAARIRAAGVGLVALGAFGWAAPALLSAPPAKKAPDDITPRAATAPKGTPRTDRYGDPLPIGAAMRLGTVRFRQAPFIKHIVYSKDSRLILTDNEQRLVQVWDARDGRKLRQLDLGLDNIRDFTLSPDGRTIAAAGYRVEPEQNRADFELTFTDLATGQTLRRIDFDDPNGLETIVYAPDGKSVATISGNSGKGILRLWEVASGKPLRKELLGEQTRTPFAFSPQAEGLVLAFADDRAVHLRDLTNGEETRTIAVDGIPGVTGLAFSPDGKTLAIGISGVESEVVLRKVDDGALVWRFNKMEPVAKVSVAFAPDGKTLAATGPTAGPPLRLDAATGKKMNTFSGSGPTIGSVAFSPDGGTVATTGDRQALHLWDLTTGKDRLATPEAHLGTVDALASLEGGKVLISGSDDRTVRFWDLATGRTTKTLPIGGLGRISVSADGSRLATTGEWRKIQVWDLKTGELLRSIPTGNARVRGLHLSPVGSSVVAVTDDRSLRTWKVATGEELPARPILRGEPPYEPDMIPEIDEAHFASDERTVALIGRSELKVVDIASGNLRFKEKSVGQAIAFAPNGRSLVVHKQNPSQRTTLTNGRMRASASTDPSKILWLDAETGDVRREFPIPEPRAGRLAFSPDGKAIAVTATSQRDRGALRIIRLRDKKVLHTFEIPSPWIRSLSFLPDGRRIVAGFVDTSILVWDIPETE